MVVKIRVCGSGFVVFFVGNKVFILINGGEVGVKCFVVKMVKFIVLLRRIRLNNKCSKCCFSIK